MNALALLLLFGQFEVKPAEAPRPGAASRFNVRPAAVAETPYQRTLRLVRAGERVKVYLTDFPNESPGVFVCWKDAAGELVYLREGVKQEEAKRADPFQPSSIDQGDMTAPSVDTKGTPRRSSVATFPTGSTFTPTYRAGSGGAISNCAG